MKDLTLTQEDVDALRATGVEAAVLFGSHATGHATEESDVDVGVLLTAHGREQRLRDYHAFFSRVYDIFAARFGDLSGLDVVFLDRAPLELRRHVARHGIVLMESVPGTVARFNDATTMLYADFEPYRELMNRAVLERV